MNVKAKIQNRVWLDISDEGKKYMRLPYLQCPLEIIELQMNE